MQARVGLSYRTWSKTKQLGQGPFTFARAQGVTGSAGNWIPKWQDGGANIWCAVLAGNWPVVMNINAWPGPEVLLSLLPKEPKIIAPGSNCPLLLRVFVLVCCLFGAPGRKFEL